MCRIHKLFYLLTCLFSYIAPPRAASLDPKVSCCLLLLFLFLFLFLLFWVFFVVVGLLLLFCLFVFGLFSLCVCADLSLFS